MFIRATTSALLIFSALPAVAQEVNGATVSAAFQSIEGDFTGDFEATSLAAGLDFAITPNVLLGAGIESVSSDDFVDDFFIGTVRASYAANARTAFGAYYSVDRFDDFETTLYGVELAVNSPSSKFEAYIGGADSDVFGDNEVLRTAGISFEFLVGAGISLGLDYQVYTVEDFLREINTGEITDGNIGDAALLARYSFLEGASIYAKAGRIRAIGDSEEPDTRIESIEDSEYITVGLQYDFLNGALFDTRTLTSYGN